MLFTSLTAFSNPWGDDLAAASSWMAEKLMNGDYDEMNEAFASELQVSLPPSKIRDVMRQVESQIGSITEIREPKQKRVRGHPGAEVLCETERGRLLVQVIFNEDKEVAGLWVVPGPKN